ncbi:MAG: hypothetical protein NPMRIOTA_50026 [Nitrosopumilales archaeon]|nr:MAG: hypothetical protein NPMRIOTA_50026 [Nitrosopumilales archaeon]
MMNSVYMFREFILVFKHRITIWTRDVSHVLLITDFLLNKMFVNLLITKHFEQDYKPTNH